MTFAKTIGLISRRSEVARRRKGRRGTNRPGTSSSLQRESPYRRRARFDASQPPRALHNRDGLSLLPWPTAKARLVRWRRVYQQRARTHACTHVVRASRDLVARFLEGTRYPKPCYFWSPSRDRSVYCNNNGTIAVPSPPPSRVVICVINDSCR